MSTIKMPTQTSKIPLPKTSSSSSKVESGELISSPPSGSKIPVIKSLKSPHDVNYSTPNKENYIINDVGIKKSRIPDIRSKHSPARELQDVDGGYRSDHSNKSGSSTSNSKLPVCKLPTSPPARNPLTGSSSRIPTLTPSPSKNAGSHLKSSMESLDDLEWDNESPRHRRSMTPGDETRPKTSSSSSSSSYSSSSPQKRVRDEAQNKSPYNEISPTKSRRGSSPSKIPIKGSYIPLRSSCEDLLRDQSGLGRLAQDSEEEEEEDLVGGGEGMAESVLGEEFLLGGTRRSPAKSRIPTSAPARTIPELNWSLSREDSPHKQSSRGESDGGEKELETPTKKFAASKSTSRLPDTKSDESQTYNRQLPRHSTSQLPSYQGSSTDSDTSSSSSETQARRRKNFEAFVMTGDRMINLAKTPANLDFQSKYYKPSGGAAVKSLDSKFGEEKTGEQEGAASQMSSKVSSLPTSPAEDSSQTGTSNQRQNRLSLVRASKSEDQLGGGGDSEQETGSEEEKITNHSSCLTLLHTDKPGQKLAPSLAPQVSSESSSSRSLGGSNDLLLASRLPSEEATSPDFSTSSLISCSEHYNGESLLDNPQMSPQSPSSPDTPEWSLIANGDSFHKDVPAGGRSKAAKPNGSLITSKDNRVIITINTKEKAEESNRVLNGYLSPGGSSSGTITPEVCPASGLVMSPPPQPPSSPPASLSSEEESDMDSLHSYHPPVKIVDIPSANRLAKRLYNLEGFRKSDISRHLSKNNDFSRAVAEEYCRLFTFSQESLDEALRKFLQQFCLTGETQDRERVLLHFSKRYLECNPALRGHTYQSQDAVHTLTCAIMLLNTDLHNEALQQRRMTAEEFVENLAELNDGSNFPDVLLKDVYAAIKAEPIEWVQDDSGAESELSSNISAGRPGSPPQLQQSELASKLSFNNQEGGVNPFLSLPDPANSVDYKRGYVMRKSCFDSNKKKTKLGKRSWKMFYLTLRDLVLYCFKDEKSTSYESPQAAIRIHHSLASIAGDYTKKQFVFRLRTSDRAEYLFQTSDQKELETWVDTINTVVSRYSAPPLAAPCGNNNKFQRPLFPSSRSNNTSADQLDSHRDRLRELSGELADHTDNPPARGAKAIVWTNYREKSEFLENELERYSGYVSVLETLMTKQLNNSILSSPMKAIAS